MNSTSNIDLYSVGAILQSARTRLIVLKTKRRWRYCYIDKRIKNANAHEQNWINSKN
jgi:hypothetical protein